MASADHGTSDILAGLHAAQLAATDGMRRMQAGTLDLLGFGVRECPFALVASGPHWRLRRYAGPTARIGLLLVPAPIKRPYIWDLTPNVSAVRFCLRHGFAVHLLEWLPPRTEDGGAGIEAYSDAVIAAAGAAAADRSGTPFVIGHSLGGTLAAIACARQPGFARGLVLLGAPLSFEAGSSPFRDLVVAQKAGIPQDGAVPGSLLSQSCAMLSPAAFVWARWTDGALSLADPAALDIHMHVERWALDEVPLPGRLMRELVDWLYREDRFHRGRLALGGRKIGPADIRIPVLAAVNPADEIGPGATVEPFLAALDGGRTRIVEHPAEIGVGLQHLAILVGRRAHAETWPEIAGWIEANA